MRSGGDKGASNGWMQWEHDLVGRLTRPRERREVVGLIHLVMDR